MSHPLSICFSLRRLTLGFFVIAYFKRRVLLVLWVEWLHRFVISWPVVDAVQNSVSVKIWLAYTPSWKNCFSLIEAGKKSRKGRIFFSLKCVVFFFFFQTRRSTGCCRHTSLPARWLQPVVHVIANQVTDALEVVVFGAHLWQQKRC